MPVAWPGRYLVTFSDRPEVGVIEKVETTEEGAKGTSTTVSGRFAECLWDRYGFPSGGSTVRGATWAQAVTQGLLTWHMGDLPPLALGTGAQKPTGTSYALTGSDGDTAMSAIYSCATGNDGYPRVSYDRASDPSHLILSVVKGTNRTRSQSSNPWFVLSLSMETTSKIGYSGDYSTMCSAVLAHAESGSGTDTVTVDRTVPVPGFDAATMWRAQTFEDVSSLLDQDQTPTAALVDSAGGLRAYDHMAALSIDCSDVDAGYRTAWDLGDTVDIEIPSLLLASSSMIVEVREIHKVGGGSLEVTVGNRQLTRLQRAMIGRR